MSDHRNNHSQFDLLRQRRFLPYFTVQALGAFNDNVFRQAIIGLLGAMALAGLMPVPEIQFRKYAEPATEQINDCGTIRWRTNNRFAAPMVLRMPGGYFKCGDPWHSQTNEVAFVHQPGWKVAVNGDAR